MDALTSALLALAISTPLAPLHLGPLLKQSVVASTSNAGSQQRPLTSKPADQPTAGAAHWPLKPTTPVALFDAPTSTWGAGHRGVDLAGSPGQTVHAALAGQIAFVGQIAGKAVVTVDHGAQRTTYEPVISDLVRGENVAAGAPIGTLATHPSHCAPRSCLHWGLIRASDNAYLDPLTLFGRRPVRLLPTN